MDGTDTPRAATDIDRLLFFIAGVVVLVLVVPPVLGMVGIDVRDGSVAEDDGPLADAEGVQILSAFGTGIDENRSSIGVVELVVGTDNETSIQLDEVTVTWENGQQFELTPPGVNAGHGSFNVSGDPTLDEPTDRAILRFDLGTDDLPGVARFGDRLEPGDTVRVTVTTGDGDQASRVLTVPDPLPPGAGVTL